MNLQVIAESIVNNERRLLVGHEGRGYIQLDSSSLPIEVPPHDFERLRSMGHYRPVAASSTRMLEESFVHQVAD